MRFSIIIPVYNREKSIIKSVESITEQTFRDWELILVNDGSSDETGVVCMDVAEKDNRVIYIYQENKGVSAARNNGIKNARGEYILFLDSDDGFEPDALETLDARIREYPEAELFVFGIVGTELLGDGIDGIVSKSDIQKKYLPAQLHIDASYEKYFVEHYVWNKCYKSTFLKDNNITFDEEHFAWEDGLFVIDCMDKAKSFVLISKALSRHDICNQLTHLSNSFFDNQTDNYVKDAEAYKSRFGDLYDFDNSYHSTHNVRMLGLLISKAVGKYGKESVKIIKSVVENPLVQRWNAFFLPETKYERLLKRFIAEKKAVCIYKVHRNGIFRKIRNKVKKLLH